MLLNIHTHLPITSKHCSILNVSDCFDAIPNNRIFSAGIHPWHIEISNFQDEINKLSNSLKKDNVVAVGQCGLDKICDTSLQLQENCFRQQIQLAYY